MRTNPAPTATADESVAAIARIPETKVAEIDTIVQKYGLAKCLSAGLGGLATTLTVAEGLQRLEAALTPEVMKPIMRLRGSKLGFLTDKDREAEVKQYDEVTVKRCVIEGFLRGVRPVLNEMNIIGGNFYATREAFTRLLSEYPGLTDLRIELGVPRGAATGGGAVVSCKAAWRMNGQPDELTAEIPVRVNSGMGVDAVLGKADRKLKARVFWRITGSELTVPEGEVEPKDVTPTSTARAGAVNASEVFGPSPATEEKTETPAEGEVVLLSAEKKAQLRAMVAERSLPAEAADEIAVHLTGGGLDNMPASFELDWISVLQKRHAAAKGLKR